MNTIKIDKKNARLIAHRGVSGLETENTLAAFVAAGNRSYFGIECDVHVTGDGKFAVIHDDDTLRVCGEKLIVEECAYDALRELRLHDIQLKEKKSDFKRSDWFIPELCEYISVCKKYSKVPVLELKNEMPEENVHEIIEEIKSLDYLKETIFISFSRQNLTYIRNYDSSLNVQFLTESYNKSILEDLIENRIDIDIYYKAVDIKLIETLHASGLKVNCWTVDNEKTANKLISMGVDFITSNILE